MSQIIDSVLQQALMKNSQEEEVFNQAYRYPRSTRFEAEKGAHPQSQESSKLFPGGKRRQSPSIMGTRFFPKDFFGQQNLLQFQKNIKFQEQFRTMDHPESLMSTQVLYPKPLSQKSGRYLGNNSLVQEYQALRKLGHHHLGKKVLSDISNVQKLNESDFASLNSSVDGKKRGQEEKRSGVAGMVAVGEEKRNFQIKKNKGLLLMGNKKAMRVGKSERGVTTNVSVLEAMGDVTKEDYKSYIEGSQAEMTRHKVRSDYLNKLISSNQASIDPQSNNKENQPEQVLRANVQKIRAKINKSRQAAGGTLGGMVAANNNKANVESQNQLEGINLLQIPKLGRETSHSAKASNQKESNKGKILFHERNQHSVESQQNKMSESFAGSKASKVTLEIHTEEDELIADLIKPLAGDILTPFFPEQKTRNNPGHSFQRNQVSSFTFQRQAAGLEVGGLSSRRVAEKGSGKFQRSQKYLECQNRKKCEEEKSKTAQVVKIESEFSSNEEVPKPQAKNILKLPKKLIKPNSSNNGLRPNIDSKKKMKQKNESFAYAEFQNTKISLALKDSAQKSGILHNQIEKRRQAEQFSLIQNSTQKEYITDSNKKHKVEDTFAEMCSPGTAGKDDFRKFFYNTSNSKLESVQKQTIFKDIGLLDSQISGSSNGKLLQTADFNRLPSESKYDRESLEGKALFTFMNQ